MLKREVREMVKYLINERKSFKVVFANNEEATVEYKGFCWVVNGKAFSDSELVEKMVRFQNNEKKFIVKFEEIEEVVEENKEAQEAEIEEEVENLNNDLFQEEDIAYCEEAIERETNENEKMELKIGNIYKYKNEDSWFDSLNQHRVRLIEYKTGGDCKIQLIEKVEDVGWWHDGIILNCKSTELRRI